MDDKELAAAHIHALANTAIDYVDVGTLDSKSALCAMLDSIAMWADALEKMLSKEDTAP